MSVKLDLIVPKNFGPFLENGVLNLDKLEKQPEKLLRLYVANVGLLKVKGTSIRGSLNLFAMKEIETILKTKLQGYHLLKFKNCKSSETITDGEAKKTISSLAGRSDLKSKSQILKVLSWMRYFNETELGWARGALKGEDPDLSGFKTEELKQLFLKCQKFGLNDLCKKIVEKSKDNLDFIPFVFAQSESISDLIKNFSGQMKGFTVENLRQDRDEYSLVITESLGPESKPLLEKLAKRIPNVSYVHKNPQSNINETFLEVIQKWPNLGYLAVESHSQACSDAIKKIIGNFPTLRALKLSGHFNDALIQEMIKQCKTIEGVDLSGCDDITDESVKSIAQNCKGLFSLFLKGSPNLTDDSIGQIAQNCSQLGVLCLQDCAYVTDHSLKQIAQNCKKIEALAFYNCSAITEDFLESFAKGCRLLKFIQLDSCPQFTDSAIQLIAEKIPELDHLGLNGCHNLTNRAAEEIAKNCKKLKFLELKGSPQISDDSIQKIMRECKSLRNLILGQGESRHVQSTYLCSVTKL